MRSGACVQAGGRPAAYYDQSRPEVAALVPSECLRVLDIGQLRGIRRKPGLGTVGRLRHGGDRHGGRRVRVRGGPGLLRPGGMRAAGE